MLFRFICSRFRYFPPHICQNDVQMKLAIHVINLYTCCTCSLDESWKMSLSIINFLKEDVRLVNYENRIYKFKIIFEEKQELANFVPPYSQKNAHHELEAVVRAVLFAIEKKQSLNKIQTDKFIVSLKTKSWGAAKKLGFKQDGVLVPSHPFMIILNVTVKDLVGDDASNNNEISVTNQTPEPYSRKNFKNTAVSSNLHISRKRLSTEDSTARTINNATHQKQTSEKDLSVNVDDILSTQEICDLLDEARNLREVENLERCRQETKEKETKAYAEQFANEYAKRVVKEKGKNQKVAKIKADNFTQRSSPRREKRGIIDDSDILKISKTPSPKKNAPHRQVQEDHRQNASPTKCSQQPNSQKSVSGKSESDSGSRKRKLSESPQEIHLQSENPPVRGRGGPRKIHFGKSSASIMQIGTLRERKKTIQSLVSLTSKAVKKKYLKNNETQNNPIILPRTRQNVVRSADESESKRLRLQLRKSAQIRKSPRIQQRQANEKRLNTNNNAGLKNSGISMNQLRKTRRDRHLIEQDELVEDMKLQQLAKSSPKEKQKNSAHKRRSSTLWNFIVSPVKELFS